MPTKPTPPPRLHRKQTVIWLSKSKTVAVAGLLLTGGEVIADTSWISTSSSLFTTTANWSNGLPSTGPQLGIFPDSGTVQHTIDIQGTTARNAVGLLFTSYSGAGSAGFVFNSSTNNSPGFQNRAVNLLGTGASILNDDDNTQTFNVPYRSFSSTGVAGPTAAQTFFARNGGLIFSGVMATRSTVDNNGGMLTLDGSFDITIGIDGAGNGDVVGAGGLTKDGTGTLTLGGTLPNTFSGGAILNNGSTVLRKVNALGTSTLQVNSPAVLDLGAHAQIVGGVTIAGGTVNGSGTLTGTSFAIESGTINAVLAGAGGLTKSTAGVASLTNTNTYGGTTLVNGGTLSITGVLNGTAGVDIAGGILAGNGVIAPAAGGGVTLSAGKLSPGTSVGNLTVALTGGELDLSPGVASANTQALVFELGTPFSSDLVSLVGGPLSIGAGALEFDDFAFTALAGFAEGDYLLFDGDAPIVGSLGAGVSGLINGFQATLVTADGGNDLVLQVVPEPGSAALLVGGFALLLNRRKRRA